MRLVSNPDDLKSALRAARSEAKSAFGDDRVYVEKAIIRPRHVEVQVFGDTQGNVIHLYERECSIQRRHQKVIEESPSLAIDQKTREEMGRVAVQAAKAVNYVGAGTIEFLVDQERRFYFLEMNTRIQVEHAITEAVTGVDLVKKQIEVAAGRPLGIRQEDVVQRGWAIECRIYAEDPENNFLPAPGRIEVLRVPSGIGIRDDSGVYEGFEVSRFYDPMISKLIAWGSNREEATQRMLRALHEYVVVGPGDQRRVPPLGARAARLPLRRHRHGLHRPAVEAGRDGGHLGRPARHRGRARVARERRRRAATATARRARRRRRAGAASRGGRPSVARQTRFTAYVATPNRRSPSRRSRTAAGSSSSTAASASSTAARRAPARSRC
jgi:acetyl/propionyl-CoA carboxylase alpha subunit